MSKTRSGWIKDAQFLNERIFTDIYYDTKSFTLTSNDKWLRSREGRFELKLPFHDGAERLADQYDELEDDRKIKEALNLPSNGNLANDLAKAGYSPFCISRTTLSTESSRKFCFSLIGKICARPLQKCETKFSARQAAVLGGWRQDGAIGFFLKILVK